MNIGDRIHELRLAQNMTLEQVGNAVGVGKSTVRKWETGQIANMRRDKIANLAAALHTTPAYLMGWEEQPEATPPQPETSLTLTPVEEALVTDYRRLTPPGQEYIRQTMAMALRSYSEKNHPVSQLETAQ